MGKKQQSLAAGKSEFAKCNFDLDPLPFKSARAECPAIEGRSRKSRARPHSTPENDNIDPFGILDLLRQAEKLDDAKGDRGQQGSRTLIDRIDELEGLVEKQRGELSNRSIQIAELYNAQYQQADALQIARAVIEKLDESAKSLAEKLAQRENEVGAAKQEALRREEENNALRGELEKTRNELAQLMQKHLELSTAFNDREVTIACVQEKAASLELELDATAKDVAKGQRFDDDRGRDTRLECQMDALEAAIMDHDGRIGELESANAKLSERSEELAHRNFVLELAQKDALEKIKSQAGIVKSLKCALREEREAAERKMADLAADLQREREERSILDRETARIRKELEFLLPRLAMAARLKRVA